MNKDEELSPELIKQIAKSVISHIIWPIIVPGFTALLAVGIWVGTLQSNLAELNEYKRVNEPLKQEMHRNQERILSSLEFIIQIQNEIKQDVKANTEADRQYRQKTNENIANFYRKNPDL